MADAIDIARRAEQLGDRAVQLAQALVRANTVNRHSGDAHPGNEKNGQRIIQPLLAQLGADIEQFDCPPDIYRQMGVLGPRDRDFSDRPNLVASLAYGASGPTIIIQAHMDTVGVTGMALADPFSGTVEEGVLWGRGSSDMKGGMAAAVTALQALHDVRTQLHGRILFASVVEEESNGSGAGALSVIQRASDGFLFGGAYRPAAANGSNRLADMAICTDGTGPQIYRGYGGVLTVDVHVDGRAGHAAGTGSVSAIEKALVVKQAIDQYKSERERAGPGRNVNLGLFRGGTHPAVVAGHAIMSLNMSYAYTDAVAADEAGGGFGYLPGRQRFESLIHERCNADEWLRDHPPVVDWIKDLIPFELPASDGLVQHLATTHRRILGQDPAIGTNPAWSDACYLPRFGSTPAVCFGAGSPGQAHSADEHCETWRIVDCARVLAAFLFEQLRA